MIKKILISLAILIAFISIDQLLGFVIYSQYNHYQRIHLYKKIKAPENLKYKVNSSLVETQKVNKGATWPNRSSEYIDYSQRSPSDMWDPNSYYLKPHYIGRSVAKYQTDKILYDVEVKTDSYGNRVSYQKIDKKNREALILLGDSLVFGEGVNTNETISSFINKLSDKYIAYNYGIPAGDPQKSLARLQDLIFKKEINEKIKAGYFLFLPDHIRRVNESIFYFKTRKYSPYFYENKIAKLIRFNYVSEIYPIKTMIYELLGQSFVLTLFNLDFPWQFDEKAYKRTARILAEMKRIFNDKLKSEFYVFIYPDNELNGSFKQYLEAEKINYLDYENVSLPEEMKDSPFIYPPYDLSPGKSTFSWIAQILLNNLK